MYIIFSHPTYCLCFILILKNIYIYVNSAPLTHGQPYVGTVSYVVQIDKYSYTYNYNYNNMFTIAFFLQQNCVSILILLTNKFSMDTYIRRIMDQSYYEMQIYYNIYLLLVGEYVI